MKYAVFELLKILNSETFLDYHNITEILLKVA
jgi:hypothetical protein